MRAFTSFYIDQTID